VARATNTHGRSGIWESQAFVRALAAEKRRLGARLRKIRLARRWTLERASERARLHPVSLSRIESGKANVTVATLLALARAYRVELADLF
jgi:DNA-binding Xre family transcriptional regulator